MRLLYGCLLWATVLASHGPIDRRRIVQSFNPVRNKSSPDTPLQVGNGNFAFGADISGLQTFSPFAILSTWAWHNLSLPTTPGQTDPRDFRGVDWWVHGRLVNYNQASEEQPELSAWLRENPSRINLGRLGFSFGNRTVDEAELQNASQVLDLWTGVIYSSFVYDRVLVQVQTVADPETDTVAISVESELLRTGGLAIFVDFPYPLHGYFEAPFVGVFNATGHHRTTLAHHRAHRQAQIEHRLGNTAYYAHLQWDVEATVSGPNVGSHRYQLRPRASAALNLSVSFSPWKHAGSPAHTFAGIRARTGAWWEQYWSTGAFLDLTATESEDAKEMQRRTILSLYLVAVNSASSLPPQESGLTNNGWFGKFHMEMLLWHLAPFACWNHWSLFRRSLPRTYTLFLPSAMARARHQGYTGARWGKMADPFFGDAPGEINALLIWQQPHAMYLAELEYRSFPAAETLAKWHDVIAASAEFMADFAWWNRTRRCYQLGPPMYPVSENTAPNATKNPTFELAYWRFGLEVAVRWYERQGKPVPGRYIGLLGQLCALPVDNGTYPIYEGIPNMWTDNATVSDHPAMLGIFGLLPPPRTGRPLNMTVLHNTAARVLQAWDLDYSFGWDFALLAMNALRLGDASQAIKYLLHEAFPFDDAGYPVGGARVPTPYFPSSGGLLLAVAMMAGGWDGHQEVSWPEGWQIRAEGFTPGL